MRGGAVQLLRGFVLVCVCLTVTYPGRACRVEAATTLHDALAETFCGELSERNHTKVTQGTGEGEATPHTQVVKCMVHHAFGPSGYELANATLSESVVRVYQPAHALSVTVRATLDVKHMQGTKVSLQMQPILDGLPAPSTKDSSSSAGKNTSASFDGDAVHRLDGDVMASGLVSREIGEVLGLGNARVAVLKQRRTGEDLDGGAIALAGNRVTLEWKSAGAEGLDGGPEGSALPMDEVVERIKADAGAVREGHAIEVLNVKPDQSLARFLAGGASAAPGDGETKGKWTLVASSKTPIRIAEWSIEMCYDAAHNFDAECPESGPPAVNAMSRPRVQGLIGRLGGRMNIFPQDGGASNSDRRRFWFPGSGLLGMVRSGWNRRFHEESQCLASRFSFNLFERANRRYCCKKSRVFFWRHFMRKRFTFRCRRFFKQGDAGGSGIFRAQSRLPALVSAFDGPGNASTLEHAYPYQDVASSASEPAPGLLSRLADGMNTLVRNVLQFAAGAVSSTVVGQVVATGRNELVSAVPIGAYAVASTLWTTCQAGDAVIVTSPRQWQEAFTRCCNVVEVRGLAGAIVPVDSAEFLGGNGTAAQTGGLGYLSEHANRRAVRVMGPDGLQHVGDMCHQANLVLMAAPNNTMANESIPLGSPGAFADSPDDPDDLVGDTITLGIMVDSSSNRTSGSRVDASSTNTTIDLLGSSLDSPAIAASILAMSGEGGTAVGDGHWGVAVWELQGEARVFSNPALQYIEATYANLNELLVRYLDFPASRVDDVVEDGSTAAAEGPLVPQKVIEYLQGGNLPSMVPSGYSQILSSQPLLATDQSKMGSVTKMHEDKDGTVSGSNTTTSPEICIEFQADDAWKESFCDPVLVPSGDDAAGQVTACRNNDLMSVQSCSESPTCFVKDPQPAYRMFENDQKLLKILLTSKLDADDEASSVQLLALKLRAYLQAQLGLGPAFSGIDGFTYGCNATKIEMGNDPLCPLLVSSDGEDEEEVDEDATPTSLHPPSGFCCHLSCLDGICGGGGLARYHREYFAPNLATAGSGEAASPTREGLRNFLVTPILSAVRHAAMLAPDDRHCTPHQR